ncbi:putative integrator complex subunit 3 [Helianthus annuus]|nr:putative integrator complex subunit 3 [Helianthus annuus]KAJ0531796.1 putative integrator complex subunit 3 [Helianthus annuus]KAJ0698670.1 putative integrator complex subunit 3 [Helianthus annuus]
MASSLIHKSTYEADNPLESSLIEAFRLLEPELRPPFPLTIRTEPEYFNLNRAILYGILSETHLAKVHLKHLHGIVTDGVCLNSKLKVLKQKEIEFCIRVFKDQFHLCLKIGRDLIRVLQDLVHVPEFHDLWKDLLSRSSDACQLYRSRTCSRYFLLRITPEMETHLRFLLTQVKLGSQTRYQIWFGRKFLNGPEKETVVIDIVRFICCAHHPSNDILLSNVIPRWIIVGWLLKCCTKNHIEANVKLALFYDWLFFEENVDNIMNIEPAILLMVNSVPKYIHMTHNLLEFLFLLVDHYDIDRKDLILKGVSSALDVLKRKGVVQSFDVLTCCDMLSPFLKERLVKMLSCKNVSGFNHLQPVTLA